MSNSKKHLYFKFFVILIISILANIFVSNKILNLYEDDIIKYNSYILNSLAEDNEEMERKIVSLILNDNYDDVKESKVLEKYGITRDRMLLTTNVCSMKENILKLVLFSNIGIIIVIVIIFFIHEKREEKQIAYISNYLTEVLSGNYYLDILSLDEGKLSQLKSDIYKVIVKLKEQHEISLKDKKQLEETLSDISHQLKTPLTSMYVINDVLRGNPREDVKRELLQKERNQLERIEWLVTSLLKMSMLDSGTTKLNPKEESIEELIDKAIDPLKIPIELKEIKLKKEVPKGLKSTFDFNWTREALINIIKNAYEHTEKEGTIEIKAFDNPIYVSILISDNGCGISEKDINHIFERFYKGSGNKDSIGIGLNMAKKIIDLEKGEIKVKSKEKEGTTFTIKFYKNII